MVHRGFGFGALRHLSPEARIRFADKVLNQGTINSATKSKTPALQNLKKDGFAKVGSLDDQSIIAKALDYFGNCEHYAGQVFTQSNGIPIRKDFREYSRNSGYRYICFKKSDSLTFFDRTLNQQMVELKRIADDYCGFETQLYGINTFCTIPGTSKDYAMRIHRDYDDFCSLTFFVCWTKTSEDDGATLYIPQSHRSSEAKDLPVALSAQPGEIFALDTFGLHAGNEKVVHSRLVTWIRFGNKMNLATVQDGI